MTALGLEEADILYLQKKKFLNLSKYSLSEVHSNAERLLFKFNRLQYTLAAPEVFVALAFANPVRLSSGPGTGSASSETQTLTRSKPHPYSMIEHAYTLALLGLGP